MRLILVLLLCAGSACAQITNLYTGLALSIGTQLSNVATGGGATCSMVYSNDATGGLLNFGQGDGNTWAGSTWTPTNNCSVCEVWWKLTKGYGTLTSKTYKAQVWTLNGTSLDTKVGESSGVTGDTAWSGTWVRFVVPSPFSVSSSTQYVVVVTTETYDASNFAQVSYAGLSGVTSKFWNGDKTQGSSYSLTLGFDVYTQ